MMPKDGAEKDELLFSRPRVTHTQYKDRAESLLLL